MRFLTQTWRLSLGVASVIALFIATFILMAQHMFKADKTSFVLQTQRQQIQVQPNRSRAKSTG